MIEHLLDWKDPALRVALPAVELRQFSQLVERCGKPAGGALRLRQRLLIAGIARRDLLHVMHDDVQRLAQAAPGRSEQRGSLQSDHFGLRLRVAQRLLDALAPGDILEIDGVAGLVPMDTSFDPGPERLGKGFKSPRQRVPHGGKATAMRFAIQTIREYLLDRPTHQLSTR